MESCHHSVARSISAHRMCHILSHGITLCLNTQAVSQMLWLDNIKHISLARPPLLHWLLWRLSLLPWKAAPCPFLPTDSLSSLPAHTASISNANNKKKQTISEAAASLGSSSRRACSPSSLPVGNYLFPVGIIILQHTGRSYKKHISFPPAAVGALCSLCGPHTPTPCCGVKGTGCFHVDGGGERREGEGGVGATMGDENPLD